MEYLKLILTYMAVNIIFDVPFFLKGNKTKDYTSLKYMFKSQIFILLGMLGGSLVSTYLLKIDSSVFRMPQDLIFAICLNISVLISNLIFRKE